MGEPTKNTKVSRRDFLKIGTGFAGLALLNKYGLGQTVKSIDVEAVVDKENMSLSLQYLKQVEEIPNGVENVPDRNENFQYADITLQKAIDIYKGWTGVDPFYIKPKNYLDVGQGGNILSSKKNLKELTINLDGIKDLDNKMIEILEQGQYHPFTFSAENIDDAANLVAMNPGSGIIDGIISKIGNKNVSSDEIAEIYKEKTGPIWNWVTKNKSKDGMEVEVLVATMMFLNDGDIGKSLWDADVLAKARARNSKQTLKFNHPANQADLPSIIAENEDFIRDISDSFAPRISARWVLDNVHDKSLFAYPYKDRPKWNYKPFDRYAAAGNIYHGLGVMALCGNVSPLILDTMVNVKHLLTDGKIGIKRDYGWEKMAVGWLVASRAGKITQILDSYKRTS